MHPMQYICYNLLLDPKYIKDEHETGGGKKKGKRIIHPAVSFHDKDVRSKGTLLPRPALYIFWPPMNSLGLGNSDSF